jgi:tetratricopeptide (TPR) repeat protein
VAVAESLAIRYPVDARALLTLSSIKVWSGDWLRAADAAQRAIALDSASSAGDTIPCSICDSFVTLAGVYSWWDSMPAAIRATKRFLSAVPENAYGFEQLTFFALRNGDTALAADAYRRRNALHGVDPVFKFRYDLFTEAYDEVERDVRSYLASPKASDRGEAYWAYFMALRSQGRLGHARLLAQDGWFDGLPQPPSAHQPSALFDAIVALDMGDARTAVRRYGEVGISQGVPASIRARELAWRGVRIGMAAAYAGDTARVLAYADSVERWGSQSLYGRDPRLHHFLRGKLLAMKGQHAAAVREYEAAIHSRSLGFTRGNHEAARSYLALGQPHDAVAILQAAMRGVLDASNLYVSRTELHELLAESFVRANQTDSAAAHYRAVVKAWERADPVFQPRRARAADWLAGHAPASRIARR